MFVTEVFNMPHTSWGDEQVVRLHSEMGVENGFLSSPACNCLLKSYQEEVFPSRCEEICGRLQQSASQRLGPCASRSHKPQHSKQLASRT